MFWADILLSQRKGKEIVNDAWTPSGIIHMGGLKGPVIHDVLFRIIQEQKRDGSYMFGFDDMDAIDGLPLSLQDTLGKYMGIPICNAPAPEGEGSFGDYYASVMEMMFQKLGIQAKIYRASENYRKGVYDNAIRFVLDHAKVVREVYGEMYHKQIPDSWYPLQVVCPTCGKVGTTTVTGWDGSEVMFVCERAKVKWAVGCETRGKISPFGGNATMPFKVEWAAKWWTFNVTIEGAGKDHASAGGTYDVARKLIHELFKQEPPLWLPYEFFLYDGKKMSSSKGLGLTGQELLEVLPPQLVRFLMIKTEPNTAIEFNPFGTQIIPKLFDEYQKAATEYQNNEKTDFARAFELSQIGNPIMPSSVRFSTLAQWVQMPNMEKTIEKEGLSEWVSYAKVWIEKYAPESEKFQVTRSLPESAMQLSEMQKRYLTQVVSMIDHAMDPEEFQKKLYELAKEIGIPSKDAFSALYISLIGKNHGPKAAWLLLSLPREFLQRRFQEVIHA